MVYAQPRRCPRECDTQTPMGYWNKNRTPKSGLISYYLHTVCSSHPDYDVNELTIGNRVKIKKDKEEIDLNLWMRFLMVGG